MGVSCSAFAGGAALRMRPARRQRRALQRAKRCTVRVGKWVSCYTWMGRAVSKACSCWALEAGRAGSRRCREANPVAAVSSPASPTRCIAAGCARICCAMLAGCDSVRRARATSWLPLSAGPHCADRCRRAPSLPPRALRQCRRAGGGHQVAAGARLGRHQLLQGGRQVGGAVVQEAGVHLQAVGGGVERRQQHAGASRCCALLRQMSVLRCRQDCTGAL